MEMKAIRPKEGSGVGVYHIPVGVAVGVEVSDGVRVSVGVEVNVQVPVEPPHQPVLVDVGEGVMVNVLAGGALGGGAVGEEVFLHDESTIPASRRATAIRTAFLMIHPVG
jgi:hypothetical protein